MGDLCPAYSQQLRGCYNVLQALVTKLQVVSQEIEDWSDAFGDLLVRMDQDGVLHDQVHETEESTPLVAWMQLESCMTIVTRRWTAVSLSSSSPPIDEGEEDHSEEALSSEELLA